MIPCREGKSKFFVSVGNAVVKAVFRPNFVTRRNPANARVSRLSWLRLLPSWIARTVHPNHVRYQLRYTRIFDFLHDTMRRKKKQVFRVCGQCCGQARFCRNFSTGKFPPQATVPRTSGLSLLGEWIGHLSSQSWRATNCAIPGYFIFLHDTMRRKKKQVFRV